MSQAVALATDIDSDENSVFVQNTLGLGVDGFNAASIPSLTNGPHTLIPCRFADTGCKEVFPELLLADIHARTFHGEAPALHVQQQRQQPNNLTQAHPIHPVLHPPAPSPCSVCAATFPTTQQMLTHVFASHPQAAEQLRQSYGVLPPVSPGPHPQPSRQAWPDQGQTHGGAISQVRCVLCKLPMPSDQALVDHLNLAHGLPGSTHPSQSFHAPAPYHQQPALGQQGGSQLDQVTALLAQLLPSLSHQPHQPHSLNHQQVPPAHQPHLSRQHILPQLQPVGVQLPRQPHLPSALPVGFHAASLFPSSHPKCSSETKLKSGLDRSVAPSAAVYILWPHEAFDFV